MRTYLTITAYALVSITVFSRIYRNSVAHAEVAATAVPSCCENAQLSKLADATCCEKENLLPAITFDSAVYDLGQVGLSTRNTCEFKFTNTGQAPLKITNVKTLRVF